jgi:hypothetical protein
VLVFTNERLVQSRIRLGRLATLAGFLALGAGLIFSLQTQAQNQPDLALLLSYGGLLLGLFFFSLAKYNALRFGIRPPIHEILSRELRGLDYKYRLYNYIEGIPVDHLLVSPFGLTVIETRPFIGHIINRGQKWSRKGGLFRILQFLSEGALGNPSRDAQRGVQAVRALLAERLGAERAAAVPVEGVVVFTHPRVVLEVTDPVVPVLHVRELRAHLRRPNGRTRLPLDLQRQVVQVFDDIKQAA